MSKAGKLLKNYSSITEAKKLVKLAKDIDGLSFGKRKKIKVPAGEYEFIAVDEVDDHLVVITDGDDLYIISRKDAGKWKLVKGEK